MCSILVGCGAAGTAATTVNRALLLEPLLSRVRSMRRRGLGAAGDASCGVAGSLGTVGNGNWNKRGYRRRRSSRVLLETLVKTTAAEGGSVMGKAPFSVKIRGSLFTPDGRIDYDGNRAILRNFRAPGPASTVGPHSVVVVGLDEPVAFKAADQVADVAEAPLPTKDNAEAFRADDDGPAQQRDKRAVEAVAGDGNFADQHDLESIDNLLLWKDVIPGGVNFDEENLKKDMDQRLERDMVDLYFKHFVLGDDGEDGPPYGARGSSEVPDQVAAAPVHFLLYGKNLHKVGSFSVVNHRGQDQTSVAIVNAFAAPFVNARRSFGRSGRDDDDDDEDEDEGNFVHNRSTGPSARFTTWKPNHCMLKGFPKLDAPISAEGDSLIPQKRSSLDRAASAAVVSGLDVLCVSPTLRIRDHGIHSVVMVPTGLGKLILETEMEGSIDLDACLLKNLDRVLLQSDRGLIKARDLSCSKVKLTTRSGDVFCDGPLKGNVTVNVGESGDFIAKRVEGPKLAASTVEGDIHIYSQCLSEESFLSSQSGNITVSRMHSNGQIEIKEDGMVDVNLVKGSLRVTAKSGTVHVKIGDLTSDSSIHVSHGEIVVTVPQKLSFGICATSQFTEVSPRLFNAGEMDLRGDAMVFTAFGMETESKSNPWPKLTLFVNIGKISIIEAQAINEKEAVESYD